MFISGRCSANSSAKQVFGEELVSCLSRATCVHFMKILTVCTLNSHLLTLKAHKYKMYIFVVH